MSFKTVPSYYCTFFSSEYLLPAVTPKSNIAMGELYFHSNNSDKFKLFRKHLSIWFRGALKPYLYFCELPPPPKTD